MGSAPRKLGGGEVLFYTSIADQYRRSVDNRLWSGDRQQWLIVGWAICKLPGEEGYYLFGCDENWRTMTDSWHLSLDEAKAQAAYDLGGADIVWRTIA